MNETGRPPAADETLIVMADDRTPLEEDVYRAPFYALCAAINLEYAKRHGYSFQYYQLGGSGHPGAVQPRDPVSWWRQLVYSADVFIMRFRCFFSIPSSWFDKHLSKWEEIYYGFLLYVMPPDKSEYQQKAQPRCAHFRLGPRAVPWAKLLALDDAMAKGYKRVVYIDSDAVFNRFDMNIDDFLNSPESTAAPVEEAALTLTFNYPWSRTGANSGFMVWRNSELAREILRSWWNVDAGDYHLTHDFEQHALNQYLLTDPGYGKHIAVIPVVTLMERKMQYVRHVTYGRSRIPRFRYALKAAGISFNKYSNLIREIGRHHLVLFDTKEDTINSAINR